MAFSFDTGEVILIDKPLTWTSFDVVKKLKFALKIKKIGHAGTLDPLATGLLILCTGKKTKEIELYQAQEKEYTGTFYLGKTTPSYDLETAVDGEYSTDHLTDELLLNAARTLEGEQWQIPPLYSAVHIDGQRAYHLARKGQDAEIKARPVFIKKIELTRIALPEVDFKVVCSKGTYIRSLARDFGLKVNSGAYLAALRRTRIGDFSIENASSLETFIAKAKEITPPQNL